MDIKTYENSIEQESKDFSERLFDSGKVNLISILKVKLNK